LIDDADPIGSGRRTSLPPSRNPEPSPEVEPMHDLAPDIIRQRILIEGYYTVTIDEDVIRKFFAHITSLLDLRTYDAPVIFAPGGEGRVDNEGYDAFVPLIDSGISLYVWTGPKFLSAVAFTCKAFDADTAVRATREFFAMTAIEHAAF
jgi:S-adenosylmethionine decarboxylase